jgi:hypothetical protein
MPEGPVRAGIWVLRLMVLLGAAGLVALFLLISPTTLDAVREPAVPVAAEPAAVVATPLPWTGPRAARSLDLYTGPSTDYVVLGVVPKGAKLEVVGVSEDGEWLAVTVAPGASLYAWLPLEQVENAPDVRTLAVKRVHLIPTPLD